MAEPLTDDERAYLQWCVARFDKMVKHGQTPPGFYGPEVVKAIRIALEAVKGITATDTP